MDLQAALPVLTGAQTRSRERHGVGDQLSPPSIRAHLSLFLPFLSHQPNAFPSLLDFAKGLTHRVGVGHADPMQVGLGHPPSRWPVDAQSGSGF